VSAWALNQDMALPEAFRYGVAAGSAALLHAGTALCRPDDVRRMLEQVQIEPISTTGV
jgi:6-phosphofructokinase 2